MIYCCRFLALYKGIVPKIMRLGPGGAIMLLVYEYMHDYLVTRWIHKTTKMTSIRFRHNILTRRHWMQLASLVAVLHQL